MNKNRIGGPRWRASEQMIATPIIHQAHTGGKSGGCASKAVELTLGRSAACHGIVTEGEAIHPERGAEVSRGLRRSRSRRGY
jgi:hypothetical protein